MNVIPGHHVLASIVSGDLLRWLIGFISPAPLWDLFLDPHARLCADVCLQRLFRLSGGSLTPITNGETGSAGLRLPIRVFWASATTADASISPNLFGAQKCNPHMN